MKCFNGLNSVFVQKKIRTFLELQDHDSFIQTSKHSLVAIILISIAHKGLSGSGVFYVERKERYNIFLISIIIYCPSTYL